jgi:hypothetical protein
MKWLYIKTSQDKIYEGLCRSTNIGNPNRAQLILLSGTPISHFPAEIALVVNILSGDSTKMCYNESVFDFSSANITFVDNKITEESKAKIRDLMLLNTILKQTSIDCILFKEFHAQSGQQYKCWES